MPATNFPAEPAVPDAQRGRASIALRYEDVVQDGRLALLAAPQALGESVWRATLRNHPASEQMRAQGVVPVLARLVIVGGEGPCAVDQTIDAAGRYEVAASCDASGAVDRLYLNMWASLEAQRGRTIGPPPERAGERHLAARIFGEHVFTRPFAPAAERKVVRLALPGLPELPEARYTPRTAAAVLAPPSTATPLDLGPEPDGAEIVFGVAHTDSNQHVNSLVYPRIFEEAAVRRLARHRAPLVLAREVEVLYRKPCFAGDKLRVVLRTFREGARYLAVGGFFSEDALATDESLATARPHCTVRMVLS